MAVRVVVPALGALPESTAAGGIPTVIVPATGALAARGEGLRPAAAARLPAYWLRARPALLGADVVHVQDHRGAALFAPAARLAGAPVLWNVHALQPGPWLDRACAATAAAVVTPTAAAAASLREATGRDVAVVPCAVPPPGHRWQGPRSGTSRRIATVARLHPVKGVDVLLEAVARLRAEGWPQLALDVVGAADPASPRVAARLHRRAARADLVGAVRFHDHLEDPWTVATAADLYVQPSRRENQAVALRQAMAAGMPVVATDLPAVREAVTDGGTGLVVPPADPAALAAALGRLLDDPAAARRLGEAAARRPLDGDPVPALLSCYRDLAGR